MMRLFTLSVLAGVLGCGGGGGGGSQTNQSPLVQVSVATPSLAMGQSTGLSAVATDADNDPLTYAWTQTLPASPQGTFSSLTSPNPSWTAPTVAATTKFTLAVTVSDGHGHSPSAPVTVFAKTSTDPSFMADVQPFLIQCFGSCHISAPGDQPLAKYPNLVVPLSGVPFCTGQLMAKAGDPDNSVLIKTMTGTSCGAQMPPGGPAVSAQDLDLVRTWILLGAMNN